MATIGNMVCARYDIEGVKPMLWHHFGRDTIPADGRKEKTGVAGNDPSEWKRSVLFVPETRQLYIEPTYIFGCLRNGAKFTKQGKGSIQSIFGATLQVEDDIILINQYLPNEADLREIESGDPVYLDVRSTVNPTTRGRNVRYRVAARKGWKTSFTILWDMTVIARSTMQKVVIDAGNLVGLGAGRPIGFGRFQVLLETPLDPFTKEPLGEGKPIPRS